MATPAAVLIYVMALLGRSADSFPPIVLLDQAPSFASANAEGFVLRDPDRIFLITSSVAFRQAQRADPTDPGPLRKVASVLIHEEWHVRHGPDEEGAYEAQLRTLFLLGAMPTSAGYLSVQQSMHTVLRRRDAERRNALAAARHQTAHR